MRNVIAHRFTTPLGSVLTAVDEGGALVCLGFLTPGEEDERAERLLAAGAGPDARVRWDAPACELVRQAVLRYLAGRTRVLDFPLALRGTPFQQRVWEELRKIPYGETISYAELARRIGRPSATRAVARANATNPVSIAVPCHRVIGSDGTLTGYAGGVEVKRALLELERRGAAVETPAPVGTQAAFC